jgi:hypothetical protein
MRLIASIDEILAQEAIWLRSGNCVKAAAASSRASPLISRLGELAAAHPSVVAAVGYRAGALLAARRENMSILGKLRVRLTNERARIAEARCRLRSMIPTYARQASAGRRSRLNAAV